MAETVDLSVREEATYELRRTVLRGGNAVEVPYCRVRVLAFVTEWRTRRRVPVWMRTDTGELFVGPPDVFSGAVEVVAVQQAPPEKAAGAVVDSVHG